ncbi:MAG: hypothetical protein ACFFCS_28470 [Candidatus Hodarchaeota archaeon]
MVETEFNQAFFDQMIFVLVLLLIAVLYFLLAIIHHSIKYHDTPKEKRDRRVFVALILLLVFGLIESTFAAWVQFGGIMEYMIQNQ